MANDTSAPPLWGLVLAGGRSDRMGEDKAALRYGGQEESLRLYELLKEFCGEVFVSCRADQANLPGRRGLPQIHDTRSDLGPTGGILTALEARPDAAWLVVACDLPKLDRETLAALVAGRDAARVATAFRGYQEFPEPMCAIYEPAAAARFHQFLAAGHDCPRKMLINSDTRVLEPPPGDRFANVNTPDEAALVRAGAAR